MQNEMTFSVNGQEQKNPLESNSSVGELFHWIRGHYISESSCIASIRVDGQELSEREEAVISLLPLSDLKKVEVTTAHPRELAEETLQDLLIFVDHLSSLSTGAAELFQRNEHPSQELAKLFDGMQTFSEALLGAKRILKVTQLEELQVLEVDLLTLMQDLLNAYHDNEHSILIDILEQHLPENLSRWRDQGIPLLIRSRDS